MERQSHIFLLEPNVFQAEKIAGLLSGLPPVESVTILTRSHNLVPMVCKCRPGFVLMGIHKAQYSRHIMNSIQNGSPETRILIYAAHSADHAAHYALGAARLGAHGFLDMDNLRRDMQSALGQFQDAGAG